MKRISVIVIFALVLGAGLLTAQEMPADRGEMDRLLGEKLTIADPQSYSLSVEEAVEMALENNLTLISQEAGLRSKRRTRDTAWNVLIPSVDASTTLSRFDEPSSFTGYEGSLSAGISFRLRLNPQLWFGFRQTMIDYELGMMDMDQARQDITTNVKKQFYNLIANKEYIRTQELQLKSLEKRYEQASINYDFGLVDEYTKLSAQVALENYRPQLSIARDGYQQALLGFKLSLGINLDSELTLEGEIEIDPQTYDADKLVENYILDRLDIQQLVANIQGLENTRKINTAGLFPSLTLGYGLSKSLAADPWTDFSVASSDWEDGNTHKTLSLTLSMSLSELLPVSQSSNTIKKIDDGQDALRANLQQALQGAELEILTAVQKANKSVQLIRAKERNVELALRAYNLAEESYNAGGKSLLDVEDAEDKLQEARYELLGEKVSYINSVIDLEAAINRKIEEL